MDESAFFFINDAVEVAKYVLVSILAIALMFVIYALAINNSHARLYFSGWMIATVLSILGLFSLGNLPAYIIKSFLVILLIALGFTIYAFKKKKSDVKLLVFLWIYILVVTVALFIII